MTLGEAAALLALGAACAAAAARTRDAFWAAASVVVLGATGVLIARTGLDPTRLFVTPDGLLVNVGIALWAVTMTVAMGLPARVEGRLLYGRMLAEVEFDRELTAARQHFIDAALDLDESIDEKARWRHRLSPAAPTREWARLADRLGAQDEDWAARVRAGTSGHEWLAWEAAQDQVSAEWRTLRERILDHRARRERVLNRLDRVGYALAVGLVVAGTLSLTNGLVSRPPAGRAAFVPEHPPGRSVHLAPLGDFPVEELEELASFYAVRYDLDVDVLPPAAIPASARDEPRDQLVAELVIDTLRATYPEAADPNRVVIGVTTEDLFSREIPDWAWAFGLRTEGHLAVVSTARMQPRLAFFADRLEAARLRKMVTKYIGVLYFGLAPSSDPTSALYDRILSAADLDKMSEEF